MFTLVWLLLSLLAGRVAQDSDTREMAGVFTHAFVDSLRGPPVANALEETAHFEAAGIAFDYPAVLRLREDFDESGRTWMFEYGMFSLELFAPSYETDVETHLELIASILAGGRSVDAEGASAGRTATVCGQERSAVRTRIKLLGDWSVQEGFDLPSRDGTPRLLMFDDEPVNGQPSALAMATYARVLGSLRCDTDVE